MAEADAVAARMAAPGITSVVLPATIRTIDTALFAAFPNATAIQVALDNPTYTTYNGMLFNKELTDLLLVPEGMEGAAVLPGSTVSVPACVFSRCTKLSAVETPTGSTGSQSFRTWNGVLYSNDLTTLIAVPAGLGASVSIAPECTAIAEGAFWGNEKLKTIIAMGNVAEIPVGSVPAEAANTDSASGAAFEQATVENATVITDDREAWEAAGFTNFAKPAEPGDTVAPAPGDSGLAYTLMDNGQLSVKWAGDAPASGKRNIPAAATLHGVDYTVSAIEDNAFVGQTELTEIDLPDTITSIGASAFAGCTALESVQLAGSVTSIGASAFEGCAALANVELGAGLRAIGAAAFEGSGLSEVVLPATITTIDDRAFAACADLSTIVALAAIAGVSETTLADTAGVSVYVPYSEAGEYAWNIGPVASANHLLPYGAKVAADSFTLNVGDTVNVFDNGGYLEAAGDAEVAINYRASAASADTAGNVVAKQPGTTVITYAVNYKDVPLAKTTTTLIVPNPPANEDEAGEEASADADDPDPDAGIDEAAPEDAATPEDALDPSDDGLVDASLLPESAESESFEDDEQFSEPDSAAVAEELEIEELAEADNTATYMALGSRAATSISNAYLTLALTGQTELASSTYAAGSARAVSDNSYTTTFYANGGTVYFFWAQENWTRATYTSGTNSGQNIAEVRRITGTESYVLRHDGWGSHGISQATSDPDAVVGGYFHTGRYPSGDTTNELATTTNAHAAPDRTGVYALNGQASRTGYDFTGWRRGSATGAASNGSTHNTNGRSLYAGWSAHPYTITFNANGGTGGPSSATATYDSALPTISSRPTWDPSAGKMFNGYWTSATGGTCYYDASLNKRVSTYTNNRSITLYAQWIPNTFDIILNHEDGTGNSTTISDGAIYDAALPTSVATPERPNYVFQGYYTGRNGTGTRYYYDNGNRASTAPSTYTSVEDLTLYAYWRAVSCSVVLDPNGGNGNVIGVTATYGEAMPSSGALLSYPQTVLVSASKPTFSGYVFLGWYDGPSGVSATSGTRYYDENGNSCHVWDKAQNTTLYAHWGYTLTVYEPTGPTYTSGPGAHQYLIEQAPGGIVGSYSYGYGNNYENIGLYQISYGSGQYYLVPMYDVQGRFIGEDRYRPTGNLTVFSVWRGTLTLNANGGTLGNVSQVTALVAASEDTTSYNRIWLTNQSTNTPGTSYLRLSDGWAPTRSGGYVCSGFYKSTSADADQYISSSGRGITTNRINFDDWHSFTTLYAHWERPVYTITLTNRNATTNGTSAVYLRYGDGYYTTSSCTTRITSITRPERTGYDFAGYSGLTNASGTITAGNTAFTSSTSIDPSWTAKVLTITLTNRNATTNGTSAVYLRYGDGYYTNAACTSSISRITVPSQLGYSFSGYAGLTNQSGDITATSTAYTANTSIDPTWSLNTYKIYLSPNWTGSTDRTQEVSFTFEDIDKKRIGECPFERPNWEFNEWRTNADGSGTLYSDDTLITRAMAETVARTESGSITLYAQWTQVAFNVTYEANGGSAVSSEYVGVGQLIPDKMNPPATTRPGYTLEGWYADEALSQKWDFVSTTMPRNDVKLYAKWEHNTFTVTFDPGRGEGASGQSRTYTYEALDASGGPLAQNLPNFDRELNFSCTGGRFLGWSEQENPGPTDKIWTNMADVRTGLSYGDPVTLYAQWEPVVYQVIYMANIPADSTPEEGYPTFANESFAYRFPDAEGPAPTLMANPFACTGYSFDGWRTSDNAYFEDGASVTELQERAIQGGNMIVLFAQWKGAPYTVHFEANVSAGETAEGTMDDQTFYWGRPDNLNVNEFKRPGGWVFDHWNTMPDDSGTSYADGALVQNLRPEEGQETPTLYAQWQTSFNVDVPIVDHINVTMNPEGEWITVDSADITMKSYSPLPVGVQGVGLEGNTDNLAELLDDVGQASQLVVNLNGQGTTVPLSIGTTSTDSNYYFRFEKGSIDDPAVLPLNIDLGTRNPDIRLKEHVEAVSAFKLTFKLGVVRD